MVYNPVSLGLSPLSEIEVFIAFLTYSAFYQLRDKIEGFFCCRRPALETFKVDFNFFNKVVLKFFFFYFFLIAK